VSVFIHPQFQMDDYDRWMGFVVTGDGYNTSAQMLWGNKAQVWGGTE